MQITRAGVNSVVQTVRVIEITCTPAARRCFTVPNRDGRAPDKAANAFHHRMDGVQEIKLPQGNFGVPDMMMHGFQNAKKDNASVHPLELSEKNWNENKRQMDMTMLRNTQGVHAPLKLHMELNVARRMKRLPGLPSSNILEDVLTGRDELIDFDDILNVPEERETFIQPHVQMEKNLHIL